MRTTQQEIATPDSIDMPRNVRPIKRLSTKWMTYTAVFSALALAVKLLGQLATLNDMFKITLIYAIWLPAAAVLGPFGGGTVCFVSDFLGALILPTGIFNPLLTVGCTLYGVIAGFCFKLPTKSYVSRFIIAGVVCTVCISLIFDSFAIWVWCKYVLKIGSFLDRTLIVYIGMRMMQCVVSTVNIPIAIATIPLLKRLKLLPKQIKTQTKPQSKELKSCQTSL